MADLTQSVVARIKLDKVWLVAVLIPFVVALFAPAQAWETVKFATAAFGQTAIFIFFAIGAVAYMKATGAETLLAKAFEGPQTRMNVLAALLGGL